MEEGESISKPPFFNGGELSILEELKDVIHPIYRLHHTRCEVTHEGTNEVKETKIGLLNLIYKNFKMEPDKDIKKMLDRFSKSVIIEAKNLKTLKLDEIMGSLLTHDEEKEDGEMAMLANSFKSEPNEKKDDQIIFYEFKKLEHVKFYCPQLQKRNLGKKTKKHKAHIATWSDEDLFDEKEVANYYLMKLEKDHL
ncbi:hypothetical protein GQ457_04G022570 [Hibiscus cannabinus]